MNTGTLELHVIVNKLIEISHDGKQMFGAASAAVAVDEPLLKTEFMQYSNQRADFAEELENEITRLGEEAAHHGTIAGAMHRGWMNLKQAVSANERHAVLSECLRSENSAIETYRDVLYADLPSALFNIVQMQCAAIERVRDRIQLLCEAAAPKDS